jgi:hypothetical protein
MNIDDLLCVAQQITFYFPPPSEEIKISFCWSDFIYQRNGRTNQRTWYFCDHSTGMEKDVGDIRTIIVDSTVTARMKRNNW